MNVADVFFFSLSAYISGHRKQSEDFSTFVSLLWLVVFISLEFMVAQMKDTTLFN
jgi:hypothetical protein